MVDKKRHMERFRVKSYEEGDRRSIAKGGVHARKALELNGYNKCFPMCKVQPIADQSIL